MQLHPLAVVLGLNIKRSISHGRHHLKDRIHKDMAQFLHYVLLFW